MCPVGGSRWWLTMAKLYLLVLRLRVSEYPNVRVRLTISLGKLVPAPPPAGLAGRNTTDNGDQSVFFLYPQSYTVLPPTVVRCMK